MNSMSYRVRWDSENTHPKPPERNDPKGPSIGPYPASSLLFDTREEAWAYFDCWFENKIKQLKDAHQNGLNQRSTTTDQ